MVPWTTHIDWTHSHYISVKILFPFMSRSCRFCFFSDFPTAQIAANWRELCTELEAREFVYMTTIGKESSVPHCTPQTYDIVDHKDSCSHKVNSWQIKCVCLLHARNVLCVFHIFLVDWRTWCGFWSSHCGVDEGSVLLNVLFCLRCYNFRRFAGL